MKIQVELTDLDIVVSKAVETALTDRQSKLFGWKFFTLKETAELLQVQTSTLLDKRQCYLKELDFFQKGKTFWFLKTSVEKFISSRFMKKYIR